MATVLIGFANALAAPEAVFSLLAAGHRVRAFARKGERPPILRHLPLGAAIEITPPEEDADAAAADLAAALDNPAIDVVLGLDDVALWLVEHAAAGKAVKLANAVGAPLEVALDKALQVAAAESAGIATPLTAFVRRAADVPAAMTYPAIVKPSRAIERAGPGLAKGATYFLENPADAATVPDLPESAAPYMVQPLVRGVGEGAFGYATANGVVAWFGHRRLRMMNPHGSGASACEPAPPEPALREAVERFLEAINWRGPFMVELLRDADGKPWFVELNGRLWGSTALARRMGFEFPAWAVQQALDPAFQPKQPPELPARTIRHLGRDLLHVLFVARGPKSSFHKVGWPKLLPTICAVLKPHRRNRFYNYDAAHRWFFLKEAISTVIATLRRSR